MKKKSFLECLCDGSFRGALQVFGKDSFVATFVGRLNRRVFTRFSGWVVDVSVGETPGSVRGSSVGPFQGFVSLQELPLGLRRSMILSTFRA